MKSRRKIVPQVSCGIPERVVCDLETEVNTDGWRRVTNNVDDQVDREGWTVMRSRR